MSRTLFDKLWDEHVIQDLGGGWSLLHVDRNLMHDLSGSDGFRQIRARGLPVANPELVVATPDHAVSSLPRRDGDTSPVGAPLHAELRRGSLDAGIQLLDIGSGRQGIVHVIGPELGIVLPGLSVACGDSHTCTNGALGTGAGAGHAVEFAGQAIRELSMEGRLTVCNMAVEMGARFGVIAPDETTFAYVKDRPWTPRGGLFEQAVDSWRQLASDPEARFDRDVVLDISQVAPTITWGTSPEQAIPIDAAMPRLEDIGDLVRRAAARAAYDYMGLEPGRPLLGTRVDWVFIGSCNASRLSDLRAAAEVVQGRHVAKGVRAWVVPGSESVKRDAEREGLDRVFTEAGFEWRDPGCSMCAAANGEQVPPLARCVSTSNRNFVGRQGPRARTHLASPQLAAAAAIAGAVVDLRNWA